MYIAGLLRLKIGYATPITSMKSMPMGLWYTIWSCKAAPKHGAETSYIPTVDQWRLSQIHLLRLTWYPYHWRKAMSCGDSTTRWRSQILLIRCSNHTYITEACLFFSDMFWPRPLQCWLRLRLYPLPHAVFIGGSKESWNGTALRCKSSFAVQSLIPWCPIIVWCCWVHAKHF